MFERHVESIQMRTKCDASKTDYHIVGESFLMPRDELYDAANLCENASLADMR